MNAEPLSWLEALKRRHPFRRYPVEVDGQTRYATRREYVKYLERCLLDTVALSALQARLYTNLAAELGTVRNELGHAVNTVYDLYFEDEAVSMNLERQRRYADDLQRRNRELQTDSDSAKRTAERLSIQVSDLAPLSCLHLDGVPNEERRYVIEFVNSMRIVPDEKKGGTKIEGIGGPEQHAHTHRFRKIIGRIASTRYVNRVGWCSTRPSKTRHDNNLTVNQDGESYWIGIPYFDGRQSALIRVDTTAKTELEAKYVKFRLSRLLA